MNKIKEALIKQKEARLSGNLYHNTQIKFAYNSNHIEGSMLTEEQTRAIFETNTLLSNTANVNDIVETLNHFFLFDYILDNVEENINEEFIKECHKLLKRSTTDERKEWFNVGEYKKYENEVGGKITTTPKDVEKEIKKLLDEYNKINSKNIDDILYFHYKFESIHPFQYGNGRVGRIIMFKECLKNNLTPFIIDEEHKMFYYKGLKEYEKQKGFLRDTCLSCTETYQNMADLYLNEEEL